LSIVNFNSHQYFSPSHKRNFKKEFFVICERQLVKMLLGKQKKKNLAFLSIEIWLGFEFQFLSEQIGQKKSLLFKILEEINWSHLFFKFFKIKIKANLFLHRLVEELLLHELLQLQHRFKQILYKLLHKLLHYYCNYCTDYYISTVITALTTTTTA